MPKPYIYKDRATFKIKWQSKNDEPTIEEKGYIVGLFIEILLVHFSLGSGTQVTPSNRMNHELLYL
jgi:hypothetical protein